MTGEILTQIYQLLLNRFGPQNWWPGQTRFEIIIGAILTQNTNWANVEKAIKNLNHAGLLEAERLYRLSQSELAQLIRPAGYYNIKAKRVKNLLAWLFDNYDGRLENLDGLDTERLRQELLSIKGVGPETADSILLYALDRKSFVVDAYTARIAVRHQLIEPDAGYEQLRDLFQSNLPAESALFNEYHALLVRLGKEFCRPKAACRLCPLKELPHTLEF